MPATVLFVWRCAAPVSTAEQCATQAVDGSAVLPSPSAMGPVLCWQGFMCVWPDRAPRPSRRSVRRAGPSRRAGRADGRVVRRAGQAIGPCAELGRADGRVVQAGGSCASSELGRTGEPGAMEAGVEICEIRGHARTLPELRSVRARVPEAGHRFGRDGRGGDRFRPMRCVWRLRAGVQAVRNREEAGPVPLKPLCLRNGNHS